MSLALTAAAFVWSPLPALPLPFQSDAQALQQAPTQQQVARSHESAVSHTNVIRLGGRPDLDIPATEVRRWTMTHARLGKVNVVVPIGKTPREAFTVALAERGYQVVP